MSKSEMMKKCIPKVSESYTKDLRLRSYAFEGDKCVICVNNKDCEKRSAMPPRKCVNCVQFESSIQ